MYVKPRFRSVVDVKNYNEEQIAEVERLMLQAGWQLPVDDAPALSISGHGTICLHFVWVREDDPIHPATLNYLRKL